MEVLKEWLGRLGVDLSAALTRSLDYLPSLIGAIAVLILGWSLARLARGLVRRLATIVNRLLDRVFESRTRVFSTAASVLAEAAFWLVIFLALAMAARIAGLSVVAQWLDRLVIYLPNLFIGALIILAGHVAGVLIGEQVTASARAARAGQSEVLGKLVQGAILATALILGLGQIGVDVTILVTVFAVMLAAVSVGFSIAFGLGAAEHVRNLIGARTARRELQPGISIRIGEVEGELLEITATRITLDTASGRTLVPGRLVEEKTIIVAPSTSETEHDGD